ncbi:MAG: aminoacyl--tRNA ligase-related protein [Nanoarchaeota archaeon]
MVNRKLESKGFLQIQNSAFLTGESGLVFDKLCDYLNRKLSLMFPEILISPQVIDKKTLEISGYSANFPQHIVLTSKGGKALAPASCLRVYELLKNSKISRNSGYRTISYCSRYEGGNFEFPFRLMNFHMLEGVIFINNKDADVVKEKTAKLVNSIFKELSLNGRLSVSNDPFFQNPNEGTKLIQKLKETKKEFRVKVAGKDVALASINNLEDYYTSRFKLKFNDDAHPFSTCVAFGIERVIASGLLLWKKYPKVLGL